MTRIGIIRTVRRMVCAMAGLAGALLALSATSPAAFAYPDPPPGSPAFPVQPPPQMHTIVVGGMPGWQITLIAIASALLAAALAVAVDRIQAARRQAGARAAKPSQHAADSSPTTLAS